MNGSREKFVASDPRGMRRFDYGYAATSHCSQGLTAERVLVNMDTEVHPELINSRFAYVSVSRASHDAQVFTNDAATLAESLNQDVSNAPAIDFGKSIVNIQTPALDRKPMSMRNGLGLTL